MHNNGFALKDVKSTTSPAMSRAATKQAAIEDKIGHQCQTF